LACITGTYAERCQQTLTMDVFGKMVWLLCDRAEHDRHLEYFVRYKQALRMG